MAVLNSFPRREGWTGLDWTGLDWGTVTKREKRERETEREASRGCYLSPVHVRNVPNRRTNCITKFGFEESSQQLYPYYMHFSILQ